MKLYAFVSFDTGEVGRYGNITENGYVTKSILSSNKFRNKRVKVMLGNHKVRYPRRKQITTIIPFSV
jgi:hypothetical protein